MNLFPPPSHFRNRKIRQIIYPIITMIMWVCLHSLALAQSSTPINIANIDFNRVDEGTGRLTIRFDNPGAVTNVREQGSRVVIDLENVTLPTQWQRSMPVANFATPVTRVEPRPTAQGAQVVLSTNAAFTITAWEADQTYNVDIVPTAQAAASSGSNTAAAATNTARTASTPDQRGYTGSAITFNFQDVPVRTVLQLLAEESGMNLVAADSVGGNVTLRLINVPWDQALDIVLRAKGLDQRRDGNVIWVAPQPELAAYEKALADARIEIETRGELITRHITINYQNMGTLQQILNSGAGSDQQNSYLSPRGTMTFDPQTGTLIIHDIAPRVEQIASLLGQIDRQGHQVLIEGRIVVATDSFSREIGGKLGIKPNGITSGRHTIKGINVNLPAQGSTIDLGYTVLRHGTALLDAELTVMQNEGRGEVISNPRVFTKNQQEATIQQGREVGYITVTGSTGGVGGTPNVEFKDVLLELRVTPTITPDGKRVMLDINLTKDDIAEWISMGSFGTVPSIQRREVNTTVWVDDGQTVVIGGVYEFTDTMGVRKVPWLGDVPFIGNFFKNQNRDRRKVELLVFITPKVIRDPDKPEEQPVAQVQ